MHCPKLSYQHGGGLLHGAVGHEGNAGLGGGSIDLGDGCDANRSGAESDGRSHFKRCGARHDKSKEENGDESGNEREL